MVRDNIMASRLKVLEKISYLVGVPILLAFSGYKIYQSSLQAEETRN
jgi:hypothetical protein